MNFISSCSQWIREASALRCNGTRFLLFFPFSLWWHISNTKANSWKNFHFHSTRYVLQDFTSTLESKNENKITEKMKDKRTKNKHTKKPDGTRETIYFRIGNNSTWKSNYSRYALQVELSNISLLTASIQFNGGFCNVHKHTANGPKIRYHIAIAVTGCCYHTQYAYYCSFNASFARSTFFNLCNCISVCQNIQRTPDVYALMHTLRK